MAFEFIEKFSLYCKRGDFTDNAMLKEYYEQYLQEVSEFNLKCDRLEEFLQRGMVNEARQWFQSQHPSLQEYYNALKKIDLSELTDAISLYGMSEPPLIKSDSIERFAKALESHADVSHLIAQFRKIAAGKDIRAKLSLAREILAVSPNDSNWKRTALGLENEWQEQLLANAKDAIIEKDYEKLVEIQSDLKNENWEKPLPSGVLAKIERVLNEHADNQVVAAAEKIVLQFEDMYAEDLLGNLERMSGVVQQWAAFTQQNGLDKIPQNLQDRFNSVFANWNRTYQERMKAAADDKAFDLAVGELEFAINKHASSNELYACYDKILALGRDLPPELAKRYEMEFSTAQGAERRRKMFKVVILLLVFIALASALFIAGHMFLRSRQLNTYYVNISNSCNDSSKPFAEAEALFQEMVAKHSDYASDPQMVELRKKLDEKKKLEEENHAALVSFKGLLTPLLLAYGENRENLQQKLKEIQEMHISNEDQELRQELVDKINDTHEKWEKKSKLDFQQPINELRIAFMDLQKCIKEVKLEEFSAICARIDAATEKINNMTGPIADGMRSDNKQFLDTVKSYYSNARWRLKQAEDLAEIIRQLNGMINSYSNVEFKPYATTAKIINEVPDEFQFNKWWSVWDSNGKSCARKSFDDFSVLLDRWLTGEKALNNDDNAVNNALQEYFDGQSDFFLKNGKYMWPGANDQLKAFAEIYKLGSQYSSVLFDKVLIEGFIEKSYSSIKVFMKDFDEFQSCVPVCLHELWGIKKFNESFSPTKFENFNMQEYLPSIGDEIEKLHAFYEKLGVEYATILNSLLKEEPVLYSIQFTRKGQKAEAFFSNDNVGRIKFNSKRFGETSFELPVKILTNDPRGLMLKVEYKNDNGKIFFPEVTLFHDIRTQTEKSIVFLNPENSKVGAVKVVTDLQKLLKEHISFHNAWLMEEAERAKQKRMTINEVRDSIKKLALSEEDHWFSSLLLEKVLKRISDWAEHENEFNAKQSFIVGVKALKTSLSAIIAEHEKQDSVRWFFFMSDINSKACQHYKFVLARNENAVLFCKTDFEAREKELEDLKKAKPVPLQLSRKNIDKVNINHFDNFSDFPGEIVTTYFIDTVNKKIVPTICLSREEDKIYWKWYDNIEPIADAIGDISLYYFLPKTVLDFCK